MPSFTNYTADGEFNTIFAEEVIRAHHSPTYTLAPGASRVRRIWDVPWADRFKAVKVFLGYPKKVSEMIGGVLKYYVSRALPHHMEDFKTARGAPYLWATQIENLEGIGPKGTYDDNNIPEYEYARLHVVYETLTYGVLQDSHPKLKVGEGSKPDESTLLRYVTIAFKPAAEFLTLPRGFYKWVPAAADELVHKLESSASRLLPSAELHFTWRQVPEIPPAVYTHIGCVNHEDYKIYSNNEDMEKIYKKGTLLLLGCDLNRYKLGTGHSVFDITYRIKHMENLIVHGAGVVGDPGALPVNTPVGHNYFLRYFKVPNRLEYRLLTDNGSTTGRKIFKEVDFKFLFEVK